MTITAIHKRLPVVCLVFIITTSNFVPCVVSANINATLTVSIEPSEEDLNLSKAIIQSGEFFLNVSSRASYFIIQAHSLTSNLHLSNDPNFENKSTAVGPSVGLVQMVNTTNGVYNFYLTGVNASNVLVSIQGHDDKAPIPGGCNMVLHPKDAPYQVLWTTDQMIEVYVQPAAGPGRLCGDDRVKLDMYYYYFGSSYFEEAEYYENVARMMTVEGIIKYGTKVGEYTFNSSLRHYFNNYKSLGIAFGVIARYGNSSAAYVPAASFGCNTQGQEDCSILNIQIIAVLWILMGFISMSSEDANTLYANLICIFITILYFMSQYRIDGIYLTMLLPIAALLWFCYHLFKELKWDQVINAPLVGYLLVDWYFFGFFIDTVIFKSGLLYWTVVRAVIVVFVTCVLFPCKQLTALIAGYIYLNIGWSMCFGGVGYYIFLIDVRHIIFPNFYKATIDAPILVADIIAQFVAIICVTAYGVLAYRANRRNLTLTNATTPLLGYR